MPSDNVPEPWRSLLADIDTRCPQAIEMHCIGGFAVTLHYGLMRPTGDIDVWHVVPSEAAAWLMKVGGPGTELHRKHRVHVQVSPVATVPEDYEGRLVDVFPGEFDKLRILVLDPYDLALSNLRVLGSIPRRLTIHSKQLTTSRVIDGDGFRLRGGCRWLRRRVVELVDRGAIRASNQVPVRVDGDLNARVSELLFHVRDRLALLQQQRRERVTKIVNPDLTRTRAWNGTRETRSTRGCSVIAAPSSGSAACRTGSSSTRRDDEKARTIS